MNPSTTYIVAGTAVILVGIGIVMFSDSPESTNPPTTNQQEEFRMSVSTTSDRQIKTTDGKTHSIPLEEILSGGPGKDGIPSIDNPQFVSVDTAQEWLPQNAEGIGIELNGNTRFYPYAILVWHEIVNDTFADQPVLVTYCPLCKTGIVFNPVVDGTYYEFGVSGKLWQSNLLMYNRTDDPEDESLWSQVLGEAVVGPQTGTELAVIPSTITRLSDWKQAHPDTTVLARPNNSRRNYKRDPYSGYYESDSVSFGATFEDDRLDPKALVHGIEVDETFKAYPTKSIDVGTTTDTVNGKEISITKNDSGTVRFTNESGESISHVTGFWFSWVAVHPDTALFR